MSTRSDEMPTADAGQLDPGVGRPVPKRDHLTPLKRRIVDMLAAQPRRRMSYYDLGPALWPHHLFPRAARYSSNGGPPGWAMPLGRALRELAEAGIVHEFRRDGAGHGDVWLQPPND
jgi:hypothetical protein